MSGLKRRAEVPRAAQALGEVVSKADLLEALWDLASRSHSGGCDDDAGTLQCLVDELNGARGGRGRQPIKVPEWARKYLPAKEASE